MGVGPSKAPKQSLLNFCDELPFRGLQNVGWYMQGLICPACGRELLQAADAFSSLAQPAEKVNGA
jgi:hypothetical protein